MKKQTKKTLAVIGIIFALVFIASKAYSVFNSTNEMNCAFETDKLNCIIINTGVFSSDEENVQFLINNYYDLYKTDIGVYKAYLQSKIPILNQFYSGNTFCSTSQVEAQYTIGEGQLAYEQQYISELGVEKYLGTMHCGDAYKIYGSIVVNKYLPDRNIEVGVSLYNGDPNQNPKLADFKLNGTCDLVTGSCMVNQKPILNYNSDNNLKNIVINDINIFMEKTQICPSGQQKCLDGTCRTDCDSDNPQEQKDYTVYYVVGILLIMSGGLFWLYKKYKK